MSLNLPQALASLILAAEMFARRANFRRASRRIFGSSRRAGLQPGRDNVLKSALQAAEKVNSNRLLVAQAFLPVLVLLHLSSMHSQEWLCYLTFSAASLAAEGESGAGSNRTPPESELKRNPESAKGVSKMLNRLIVLKLTLAVLIFSSLAFSQIAKPEPSGAPSEQKPTPAPAPRHDISGTWEPANGPSDGIQANGVKTMPADGKPEHEPPYTPLGLATFKAHKPLEGYNTVLPALFNDPRDKCEPIGFPRANFYNLRQTQILQNEYKLAILYQCAPAWRTIWTDVREHPTLVDGGVLVGKECRDQRFSVYSAGN